MTKEKSHLQMTIPASYVDMKPKRNIPDNFTVAGKSTTVEEADTLPKDVPRESREDRRKRHQAEKAADERARDEYFASLAKPQTKKEQIMQVVIACLVFLLIILLLGLLAAYCTGSL